MKITKLTPIIRRITAGNSNMFTGPGTNSYLLGENEVTVIDPGPPMVNHIEDLISLTGKSLKQIL
ncbi:MAG: MBL fold metallo-hydrolase, partial [Gammaproteobacteria bacterium]|nr:MBL fold metallo-hydrolase [Gammaproteobacteria bacterium]